MPASYLATTGIIVGALTAVLLIIFVGARVYLHLRQPSSTPSSPKGSGRRSFILPRHQQDTWVDIELQDVNNLNGKNVLVKSKGETLKKGIATRFPSIIDRAESPAFGPPMRRSFDASAKTMPATSNLVAMAAPREPVPARVVEEIPYRPPRSEPAWQKNRQPLKKVSTTDYSPDSFRARQHRQKIPGLPNPEDLDLYSEGSLKSLSANATENDRQINDLIQKLEVQNKAATPRPVTPDGNTKGEQRAAGKTFPSHVPPRKPVGSSSSASAPRSGAPGPLSLYPSRSTSTPRAPPSTPTRSGAIRHARNSRQIQGRPVSGVRRRSPLRPSRSRGAQLPSKDDMRRISNSEPARQASRRAAAALKPPVLGPPARRKLFAKAGPPPRTKSGKRGSRFKEEF